LQLKLDPLGGARSGVSLEELGGIGELIGGIGVIVSLVFLAIQIRRSSRIERLNARYAVSQSMSSVLYRLDDDWNCC
jgi:hypothetical protein